MKTDVTPTCNDLNPREHQCLGNPRLQEAVCCGSFQLVGDAGLPSLNPPEPGGLLGRGRPAQTSSTAHEPAPLAQHPRPLPLFEEGLIQPSGYWEHSVSLGCMNMGGEDPCPPELWVASSLVPLRLGCHLCARCAACICTSAIGTTAPRDCLGAQPAFRPTTVMA